MLAVVASAAAAAVGLFAAQACLPELSAIKEAAEAEAGSPPFHGCGDGIIAALDDGSDAGESCDPGPDASVVGCSATCQITCEPGGQIDPKTGHCYFVTGNAGSFQQARSQCRAKNGHVVTFASKSELDFVDTKFPTADGFWVGLSISQDVGGAYQPDFDEEPGFPSPNAGSASGPCPGCFGAGAVGGVFPIDPAAPLSNDTPCLVSRAGQWLRIPCGGPQRPTVCEREPAGLRALPCSSDGFCFSVPATAAKKTYLVVVSNADPDSAAQACNSLDGGSLVVFDSREEREQLSHEVVARYLQEVQREGESLWIGLSVSDAGTWSWEDSVVADLDASAPDARPLPWGNAQPGGGTSSRALMQLTANAYDTQLAVVGDSSPHLFICQRPAR